MRSLSDSSQAARVVLRVLRLASVIGLVTTVLAQEQLSAQSPSEQRRGPLLAALTGEWAVYSYAGLGQRVLIGTRIFRSAHHELVLEWEERSGSAVVTGRGFVGFDPVANRYYMFGVHSQSEAPVMFLSGVAGTGSITWSPLSIEPSESSANDGLIDSHMSGFGGDTLSWHAFDNRWEFMLVRKD